MTLLPYLTTLWETISPDLVALFNDSLPHNIPSSNLYISPNEEEDLNYTLPFQRFRISLDVDSCEGMPWCNTETDLCVANEGLDFPKHGVYKAGGQGSDTDPSYCRVDHIIHQTGTKWLRLKASGSNSAWSARTATPSWVHFRFPVPPTGRPDRLKIKLDSRYQNNLWGGNPCGYPVENGSLQLGNQCLEDLDSFGWSATYNPCGVTYDENHCEPCVAQPWDHLSPPGFWLLWSTGGEKTWHITGPYNEMNATENIHEWMVDVPEVFHGASGIDVVFFTYSQYPVRAEYPNNFPRDITETNPKFDLLTGLYRKQNGGGDWQCFQKASQSWVTLTSIETIELETRSRLNFPQSPQSERPRLFGSNWNSIQNQYMNLSCGEPNINYAGLGGLLNVRQGFEKLAFGGSECDDDFPNTIEDISLAAPYYRNDTDEINEISMDDRYRVLWLIRYLNYCDGEMYCDYFDSEDVATLTSNFLHHEVFRFYTYDFVGWWGLEYDLQTSRDMKFWCVIVDAFSDLIDADQLMRIKSKLRLVIQEFMNLFTNSHWALFNGNNWTPVLCVGAVYWAVTFWHEDYELAQDVLHSAIDSMYLHFDMYLTDGVYVEGVAEYSFMSINGIIEMDNVFEPAFGMHFPAVPWSRLKNMFHWYLDSMASDGHLVDFGDSHSKRGWSVITPLFVAYLDEILENKEANVDPCLLREYFTNQYYGLRSLSIIHPFIAKEWAPIVRQCSQGDTPFRVGIYPEGKFGYARWKSTVDLPPDPAFVDISSQRTDSYLAVHARPATFPHSEVDFSTFIYSAFGNRYITDLAYGYWANLDDLSVFDNSVRGCNALQVIEAHGVVSDGQYHGQFRRETGSIELLHDDRSYFKMDGSNVYGKDRETGWLDSMERLFVPLDDGAFLLVDSFITKESRGALTIEEYFYTFVDDEKQDVDLASRDQYTCTQGDRVNQHTIIDVLSTSMIQLSPVCSRLESYVSTDRSIFVSGTSLNGGHFLKDNIVRYPVVWEDPDDDSTWTGKRGRFRWVGSDQMTSDVRAFIFAKSESAVEITSAASKVIISVSIDGNVETFEFPSGVSQILSVSWTEHVETGCSIYESGGGSELSVVFQMDLDECKDHCLETAGCTGIYYSEPVRNCYLYSSVCTNNLDYGDSSGNTYIYVDPLFPVGERIVGDGSSELLPVCSSFYDCEWNAEIQQECAQKLCELNGYTYASFVSASNDACSVSSNGNSDEVVWMYAMSASAQRAGDVFEWASIKEAIVTADCSNQKISSTGAPTVSPSQIPTLQPTRDPTSIPTTSPLRNPIPDTTSTIQSSTSSLQPTLSSTINKPSVSPTYLSDREPTMPETTMPPPSKSPSVQQNGGTGTIWIPTCREDRCDANKVQYECNCLCVSGKFGPDCERTTNLWINELVFTSNLATMSESLTHVELAGMQKSTWSGITSLLFFSTSGEVVLFRNIDYRDLYTNFRAIELLSPLLLDRIHTIAITVGNDCVQFLNLRNDVEFSWPQNGVCSDVYPEPIEWIFSGATEFAVARYGSGISYESFQKWELQESSIGYSNAAQIIQNPPKNYDTQSETLAVLVCAGIGGIWLLTCMTICLSRKIDRVEKQNDAIIWTLGFLATMDFVSDLALTLFMAMNEFDMYFLLLASILIATVIKSIALLLYRSPTLLRERLVSYWSKQTAGGFTILPLLFILSGFSPLYYDLLLTNQVYFPIHPETLNFLPREKVLHLFLENVLSILVTMHFITHEFSTAVAILSASLSILMTFCLLFAGGLLIIAKDQMESNYVNVEIHVKKSQVGRRQLRKLIEGSLDTRCEVRVWYVESQKKSHRILYMCENI